MNKAERRWRIALGPYEWSKHTYAREPSNEYTLLGRAKKGLQYGALAVDSEGKYVLIIGDHVTSIDTRDFKRAMNRFKQVEGFRREKPPLVNQHQAPQVAPLVLVRKYRALTDPVTA